jgi:hypothetical protein
MATATSPIGPWADLGRPVFCADDVGIKGTIDPFLWDDGTSKTLFVGNFHGIYGVPLSADGTAPAGPPVKVADERFGFVNSEQAIAVLREAARAVAELPDHQTEFLEPPDVVGVEQLTVDGATIRTIAKTTADGQVTVQRDLRRALTEALEASGLSERIAASRLLPRGAVPPAYLGNSGNDQQPGGAS